jgi:multisubunit Na+/H+ antiporter MnhG subunit
MKMYLKVIGGVHVILAFLVLLLLLLKVLGRWLLRVLVLGLLRWINVYSRTHGQKQGNNINIQANTNKS